MLKILTATVRWYDNSSHEGMGVLKDGTLFYLNAIASPYKPILNQGDKIRVRYFDGLGNPVQSKKERDMEKFLDSLPEGQSAIESLLTKSNIRRERA